jgi:toxin YxiD
MAYTLKPNDEDWRSKKDDPYQLFHRALDKAFENIGEDRENFVITQDAPSQEGKTIPVEFKSETGAEVNVDHAHEKPACVDSPHVGWKDGAKGINRKKGHILLNFVPAGRSKTKD